MRHIGILVAALVATVAVLSVGIVFAAPGSDGVTGTVLGRATLDRFKIKTKDFKIQSKKSADVAVQEVRFAVGGHTGWHSHPGTPVVIIKDGQIEITLAKGCKKEVFGPGEGFAEAPGTVMRAKNVGGGEAVVIVTFLASPIGVPLAAPEADPGC